MYAFIYVFGISQRHVEMFRVMGKLIYISVFSFGYDSLTTKTLQTLLHLLIDLSVSVFHPCLCSFRFK